MAAPGLEADYLIVGAGAAGMAFADALLSETNATMVIVDRRDRPGGHWNDAYPFVRLHQPAATYGVNSAVLGSGRKDDDGPNAGLHELASGQEVLTHYEHVMRHRLVPSGRVRYLPMSEVGDDRSVTSLLSGERREVRARKVVDSTYSQISVPLTHQRRYGVGSGVAIAPPNDLPRIAPDHESFVVIGAGKTAMDSCIWLLSNGADPDSIHWIRPRDSWLLNREAYQPGEEFLERGVRSLADQVEALATANSIDDLFTRLERCDDMWRIDPSVRPTAYHCATVSRGELEELRRIRNVVRLGRVTRIDDGKAVLDGGDVSTPAGALHVDCSAIGIPRRPPRPVFEAELITPQFVRMCQPAFSAALIAHVEATFDDDDEKNALCAPIPGPNVPSDWVRMMTVELANRHRWSKTPPIDEWIAQSRLDSLSKQIRSLTGTESGVIAQLQRYVTHVGAAAKNAPRLLGDG